MHDCNEKNVIIRWSSSLHILNTFCVCGFSNLLFTKIINSFQNIFIWQTDLVGLDHFCDIKNECIILIIRLFHNFAFQDWCAEMPHVHSIFLFLHCSGNFFFFFLSSLKKLYEWLRRSTVTYCCFLLCGLFVFGFASFNSVTVFIVAFEENPHKKQLWIYFNLFQILTLAFILISDIAS